MAINKSNHEVRAMVEQAEERFSKAYPDLETQGVGRRRSIRSMAMNEVASVLGIEVAIVRQKYKRAGIEPRPVRKQERERFDYLGVPVTEAYRRMLPNIAGTLNTGTYALGSVKANLTKLVGKYPMPAPLVQRVLVAVDEAMQLLKGLVPVGICPWCKNVETLRDKCVACHGAGYLVASKKNIVPAMLQNRDTTMSGGKISSSIKVEKQAEVPLVVDDEPASDEATQLAVMHSAPADTETMPWD